MLGKEAGGRQAYWKPVPPIHKYFTVRAVARAVGKLPGPIDCKVDRIPEDRQGQGDKHGPQGRLSQAAEQTPPPAPRQSDWDPDPHTDLATGCAHG